MIRWSLEIQKTETRQRKTGKQQQTAAAKTPALLYLHNWNEKKIYLGTKQENLPSKELQENIYISLETMPRLVKVSLPFMTLLPPFNVKI